MVKTKTEIEINVSEDQNHLKVTEDGIFKLVEASKLSLDDEFFQIRTKKGIYVNVAEFIDILAEAIQKGVKDFYRPVLDPSLGEDGRLCYEPERIPVVNKTYKWWEQKAKEFMPERGSRLGTWMEYVAFCAIFMKELQKSGWSLSDALYALCVDSRELGNFYDGVNSRHRLELTGRRKILDYYDLGNTGKILQKVTANYYNASGDYTNIAIRFPVARINTGGEAFLTEKNNYTGWLVLEK